MSRKKKLSLSLILGVCIMGLSLLVLTPRYLHAACNAPNGTLYNLTIKSIRSDCGDNPIVPVGTRVIFHAEFASKPADYCKGHEGDFFVDTPTAGDYTVNIFHSHTEEDGSYCEYREVRHVKAVGVAKLSTDRELFCDTYPDTTTAGDHEFTNVFYVVKDAKRTITAWPEPPNSLARTNVFLAGNWPNCPLKPDWFSSLVNDAPIVTGLPTITVPNKLPVGTVGEESFSAKSGTWRAGTVQVVDIDYLEFRSPPGSNLWIRVGDEPIIVAPLTDIEVRVVLTGAHWPAKENLSVESGRLVSVTRTNVKERVILSGSGRCENSADLQEVKFSLGTGTQKVIKLLFAELKISIDDPHLPLASTRVAQGYRVFEHETVPIPCDWDSQGRAIKLVPPQTRQSVVTIQGEYAEVIRPALSCDPITPEWHAVVSARDPHAIGLYAETNIAVVAVDRICRYEPITGIVTTNLDLGVACWKFDDGDGTNAVDATTNHNDAILFGLTWATNASPVPEGTCGGKDGYEPDWTAMVLDGSTSYAVAPSIDSINISNAVTMVAWINFAPQSVTGEVCIVSKKAAANASGYELIYDATRGGFAVRGAGSAAVIGYPSHPEAMAGTNWFFVAGTINDSNANVYVWDYLDATTYGTNRYFLPGKLADLLPAPMQGTVGTLGTNDTPIMIGSRANAQACFKGQIAECRIYAQALSRGEMAYFYLRPSNCIDGCEWLDISEGQRSTSPSKKAGRFYHDPLYLEGNTTLDLRVYPTAYPWPDIRPTISDDHITSTIKQQKPFGPVEASARFDIPSDTINDLQFFTAACDTRKRASAVVFDMGDLMYRPSDAQLADLGTAFQQGTPFAGNDGWRAITQNIIYVAWHDDYLFRGLLKPDARGAIPDDAFMPFPRFSYAGATVLTNATDVNNGVAWKTDVPITFDVRSSEPTVISAECMHKKEAQVVVCSMDHLQYALPCAPGSWFNVPAATSWAATPIVAETFHTVHFHTALSPEISDKANLPYGWPRWSSTALANYPTYSTRYNGGALEPTVICETYVSPLFNTPSANKDDYVLVAARFGRQIETAGVLVVQINDLQYARQNPLTEGVNDAYQSCNQPFMPSSPILSGSVARAPYIAVGLGETIELIAFSSLPDLWPCDRPIWSGSSGIATKAGAIRNSCVFTNQSTAVTDFQTVIATCGVTRAASFMVVNVDLYLTDPSQVTSLPRDAADTSYLSSIWRGGYLRTVDRNEWPSKYAYDSWIRSFARPNMDMVWSNKSYYATRRNDANLLVAATPIPNVVINNAWPYNTWSEGNEHWLPADWKLFAGTNSTGNRITSSSVDVSTFGTNHLMCSVGGLANTLNVYVGLLPFAEHFETATVGTSQLHGRNGWLVSEPLSATLEKDTSARATRSVFTAYDGDQSVRVSPSNSIVVVSQYAGAVHLPVVWEEYCAIPYLWADGEYSQSEIVNALNGYQPSALFYLTTNRELRVLNGSTWTNFGTRNLVGTNDWVRFTTKYDFKAQKWAIWLHGTPIAADLSFNADSGALIKGTPLEYNWFHFPVGSNGTAWLDSVLLTNTLDGAKVDHSENNKVYDSDSDMDGMPDAWKPRDPFADQDQDWLSNLREYIFGSNQENKDSSSDGMGDGMKAMRHLRVMDVGNYQRVPCSVAEQLGWEVWPDGAIYSLASDGFSITGSSETPQIHRLIGAVNQPVVYEDYQIRPALRSTPPRWATDNPVNWYADAQGILNVENGAGKWIRLSYAVFKTNDWNHVVTRQNFARDKQTWDMYLNGVCVAENLGFSWAAPEYSMMRFYAASHATTYVSGIKLKNAEPVGLDVDTNGPPGALLYGSAGDSTAMLSWAYTNRELGAAVGDEVQSAQIVYGPSGSTSKIVQPVSSRWAEITGLSNGVVYSFVLESVRNGQKHRSNTLLLRPVNGAVALPDVGNVRGAGSQNSIMLDWEYDVHNNLIMKLDGIGFLVHRYHAGSTTQLVAALPLSQDGNITYRFVDTNVVAGTSYNYLVSVLDRANHRSSGASIALATTAGNPEQGLGVIRANFGATAAPQFANGLPWEAAVLPPFDAKNDVYALPTNVTVASSGSGLVCTIPAQNSRNQFYQTLMPSNDVFSVHFGVQVSGIDPLNAGVTMLKWRTSPAATASPTIESLTIYQDRILVGAKSARFCHGGMRHDYTLVRERINSQPRFRLFVDGCELTLQDATPITEASEAGPAFFRFGALSGNTALVTVWNEFAVLPGITTYFPMGDLKSNASTPGTLSGVTVNVDPNTGQACLSWTYPANNPNDDLAGCLITADTFSTFAAYATADQTTLNLSFPELISTSLKLRAFNTSGNLGPITKTGKISVPAAATSPTIVNLSATQTEGWTGTWSQLSGNWMNFSGTNMYYILPGTNCNVWGLETTFRVLPQVATNAAGAYRQISSCDLLSFGTSEKMATLTVAANELLLGTQSIGNIAMGGDAHRLRLANIGQELYVAIDDQLVSVLSAIPLKRLSFGDLAPTQAAKPSLSNLVLSIGGAGALGMHSLTGACVTAAPVELTPNTNNSYSDQDGIRLAWGNPPPNVALIELQYLTSATANNGAGSVVATLPARYGSGNQTLAVTSFTLPPEADPGQVILRAVPISSTGVRGQGIARMFRFDQPRAGGVLVPDINVPSSHLPPAWVFQPSVATVQHGIVQLPSTVLSSFAVAIGATDTLVQTSEVAWDGFATAHANLDQTWTFAAYVNVGSFAGTIFQIVPNSASGQTPVELVCRGNTLFLGDASYTMPDGMYHHVAISCVPGRTVNESVTKSVFNLYVDHAVTPVSQFSLPYTFATNIALTGDAVLRFGNLRYDAPPSGATALQPTRWNEVALTLGSEPAVVCATNAAPLPTQIWTYQAGCTGVSIPSPLSDPALGGIYLVGQAELSYSKASSFSDYWTMEFSARVSTPLPYRTGRITVSEAKRQVIVTPQAKSGSVLDRYRLVGTPQGVTLYRNGSPDQSDLSLEVRTNSTNGISLSVDSNAMLVVHGILLLDGAVDDPSAGFQPVHNLFHAFAAVPASSTGLADSERTSVLFADTSLSDSRSPCQWIFDSTQTGSVVQIDAEDQAIHEYTQGRYGVSVTTADGVKLAGENNVCPPAKWHPFGIIGSPCNLHATPTANSVILNWLPDDPDEAVSEYQVTVANQLTGPLQLPNNGIVYAPTITIVFANQSDAGADFRVEIRARRRDNGVLAAISAPLTGTISSYDTHSVQLDGVRGSPRISIDAKDRRVDVTLGGNPSDLQGYLVWLNAPGLTKGTDAVPSKLIARLGPQAVPQLNALSAFVAGNHTRLTEAQRSQAAGILTRNILNYGALDTPVFFYHTDQDQMTVPFTGMPNCTNSDNYMMTIDPFDDGLPHAPGITTTPNLGSAEHGANSIPASQVNTLSFPVRPVNKAPYFDPTNLTLCAADGTPLPTVRQLLSDSGVTLPDWIANNIALNTLVLNAQPRTASVQFSGPVARDATLMQGELYCLSGATELTRIYYQTNQILQSLPGYLSAVTPPFARNEHSGETYLAIAGITATNVLFPVDGRYTFKLAAQDADGARAIVNAGVMGIPTDSPGHEVIVDRTPPLIKISDPVGVLHSNVVLKGTFVETTGIRAVRVYVNGQQVMITTNEASVFAGAFWLPFHVATGERQSLTVRLEMEDILGNVGFAEKNYSFLKTNVVATISATRTPADSEWITVAGQIAGLGADSNSCPRVVNLLLNGSNILSSLAAPVNGIAAITPLMVPCRQGNNLFILRAGIDVSGSAQEEDTVLASAELYVNQLHTGDVPELPELLRVYPSIDYPLYATNGVVVFSPANPFEADYYDRLPGVDPSRVQVEVRNSTNSWTNVTACFSRTAMGIRFLPGASVNLLQLCPEIRLTVPEIDCVSTAAVFVIRYQVADVALRDKPHLFATESLLLARGCCQDVTLHGFNVPADTDSLLVYGAPGSYALRAPVISVMTVTNDVPGHDPVVESVVRVRIAPPGEGSAWFCLDGQAPTQGVQHAVILADSADYTARVNEMLPHAGRWLAMSDFIAKGVDPCQVTIDWETDDPDGDGLFGEADGAPYSPDAGFADGLPVAFSSLGDDYTPAAATIGTSAYSPLYAISGPSSSGDPEILVTCPKLSSAPSVVGSKVIKLLGFVPFDVTRVTVSNDFGDVEVAALTIPPKTDELSADCQEFVAKKLLLNPGVNHLTITAEREYIDDTECALDPALTPLAVTNPVPFVREVYIDYDNNQPNISCLFNPSTPVPAYHSLYKKLNVGGSMCAHNNYKLEGSFNHAYGIDLKTIKFYVDGKPVATNLFEFLPSSPGPRGDPRNVAFTLRDDKRIDIAALWKDDPETKIVTPDWILYRGVHQLRITVQDPWDRTADYTFLFRLTRGPKVTVPVTHLVAVDTTAIPQPTSMPSDVYAKVCAGVQSALDFQLPWFANSVPATNVPLFALSVSNACLDVQDYLSAADYLTLMTSDNQILDCVDNALLLPGLSAYQKLAYGKKPSAPAIPSIGTVNVFRAAAPVYSGGAIEQQKLFPGTLTAHLDTVINKTNLFSVNWTNYVGPVCVSYQDTYYVSFSNTPVDVQLLLPPSPGNDQYNLFAMQTVRAVGTISHAPSLTPLPPGWTPDTTTDTTTGTATTVAYVFGDSTAPGVAIGSSGSGADATPSSPSSVTLYPASGDVGVNQAPLLFTLTVSGSPGIESGGHTSAFPGVEVVSGSLANELVTGNASLVGRFPAIEGSFAQQFIENTTPYLTGVGSYYYAMRYNRRFPFYVSGIAFGSDRASLTTNSAQYAFLPASQPYATIALDPAHLQLQTSASGVPVFSLYFLVKDPVAALAQDPSLSALALSATFQGMPVSPLAIKPIMGEGNEGAFEIGPLTCPASFGPNQLDLVVRNALGVETGFIVDIKTGDQDMLEATSNDLFIKEVATSPDLRSSPEVHTINMYGEFHGPSEPISLSGVMSSSITLPRVTRFTQRFFQPILLVAPFPTILSPATEVPVAVQWPGETEICTPGSYTPVKLYAEGINASSAAEPHLASFDLPPTPGSGVAPISVTLKAYTATNDAPADFASAKFRVYLISRSGAPILLDTGITDVSVPAPNHTPHFDQHGWQFSSVPNIVEFVPMCANGKRYTLTSAGKHQFAVEVGDSVMIRFEKFTRRLDVRPQPPTEGYEAISGVTPTSSRVIPLPSLTASAEVLLHNREFKLTQPLFQLRGRGAGFPLTATYRSLRGATSGTIGQSWFGSWEAHFERTADSYRFQGFDGRQDLFINPSGSGLLLNGPLQVPPGYDWQAVVTGGTRIECTDTAGTVFLFAQSAHAPTKLTLRSIKDRFGNNIQFFYDQFGNLTEVQDDMLRSYRFFYADPSMPGRLSSIHDLNKAVMTLHHDAQGRLSRVESKPIPDGNSTSMQFVYDTPLDSALIRQIKPANTQFGSIDYDTLPPGTAHQVTYGSGAATVGETFAAGTPGQTVHTDDNGVTITRQFMPSPNQMLCSSESVGSLTTTYTYDTFAQLPATINEPSGDQRTINYTFGSLTDRRGAGQMLDSTYTGRDSTIRNEATYYGSAQYFQRQSEKAPDGTRRTYTYNGPNATLDTSTAPAQDGTSETTHYHSDSFGRIVGTLTPGRLGTFYRYYSTGGQYDSDPVINCASISPYTFTIADTSHAPLAGLLNRVEQVADPVCGLSASEQMVAGMPGLRATVTGRDPYDRVISMVSPGDVRTRYDYNAFGTLKGINHPPLKESNDASIEIEAITSSPFGLPTDVERHLPQASITAASDQEASYSTVKQTSHTTYDAAARARVETVDRTGVPSLVTTTAYASGLDRVTSVKNPDSTYTVYVYDTLGRVICEIAHHDSDTPGTLHAPAVATHYAYHPASGELYQVLRTYGTTDTVGVAYDSAKELELTYVRGLGGRVDKVTDEVNQRRTEYTYDTAGRVTRTKIFYLSGGTSLLVADKEATYANGYLASEIDHISGGTSGLTTTHTVSSGGTHEEKQTPAGQTVSRDFNPFGETIGTTIASTPASGGTLNVAGAAKRNKQGACSSLSAGDVTLSTANHNTIGNIAAATRSVISPTKTRIFPSAGGVNGAVVDAANAVTTTQINELGEPSMVTEDACGTADTRTTGKQNNYAARTETVSRGTYRITRTFNAANELTQKTWHYGDGSSTNETFAYDAYGNLATHTRRDGSVLCFEYYARTDANPLNRNRIKAVHQDTPTGFILRSFANYNVFGEAELLREYYDSSDAGKYVQTERAFWGSTGTPCAGYGCLASDTTTMYAGGSAVVNSAFTVAYTYDAFGNVTRMQLPSKAGSSEPLRALKYTYENNIQLAQVDLVDDLNNPVHEVLRVAYDATSRVPVSRAIWQGGPLTLTLGYDYQNKWDGLCRGVNVSTNGTAAGCAAGTHYDERGQVDKIGQWMSTDTEISRTYTHDAIGRLRAATPLGTADRFGNESYPLNAYDRREGNAVLDGVTCPYAAASPGDPTWLSQVTLPAGSTVTYQYDGRGNIIDDGRFTYTYDAFNRLVKAEWQGMDQSVTYIHDALGRRIESQYAGAGLSGNAVSVRMIYDGHTLIEERVPENGAAPGQLLRRYFYDRAARLPVAMQDATGSSGDNYFLLATDARGSVMGVYDVGSRQLAQQMFYSATGVSRSPGGMPSYFRLGFGGMYRDPLTLRLHAHYRDYDPEQAIWLGTDPEAEADALNVYAFYDNDRFNVVDWYGTQDGINWFGFGRTGASVGVGFVPLVGSGQSLVELITGRDYIAGTEASRGWATVGVVAGLFGGKGAVNLLSKGAQAASHAGEVTKAVRGAEEAASGLARLAGQEGRIAHAGEAIAETAPRAGRLGAEGIEASAESGGISIEDLRAIRRKFGARRIADNPTHLKLWNEMIEDMSSRENIVSRYRRGQLKDGELLEDVFNAAQQRFMVLAKRKGIGIPRSGGRSWDIHHWNFLKADHPEILLDPGHLFFVSRGEHTGVNGIHNLLTGGLGTTASIPAKFEMPSQLMRLRPPGSL